MNNIFENAYFSKPYKTRDERKAIYHCFDGQYHRLITSERCDFSPYCNDDGKHLTHSEGESPFDIISEWQEPIDEEKLDRLALDCIWRQYGYRYTDIDDLPDHLLNAFEIFKAGYLKGKMDKQ